MSDLVVFLSVSLSVRPLCAVSLLESSLLVEVMDLSVK